MILKCEMDVQSIDMVSSSWTGRSTDTTQHIATVRRRFIISQLKRQLENIALRSTISACEADKISTQNTIKSIATLRQLLHHFDYWRSNVPVELIVATEANRITWFNRACGTFENLDQFCYSTINTTSLFLVLRHPKPIKSSQWERIQKVRMKRQGSALLVGIITSSGLDTRSLS